MANVHVEVLENSAVYVNDVRITDRSTKPWGGINIVEDFDCHESQVVMELNRRGHRISVNKIDTEEYMAQRAAILNGDTSI